MPRPRLRPMPRSRSLSSCRAGCCSSSSGSAVKDECLLGTGGVCPTCTLSSNCSDVSCALQARSMSWNPTWPLCTGIDVGASDVTLRCHGVLRGAIALTQAGSYAIEVKAITTRYGRSVEIHGQEQLRAPDGGALLLAVMRLARVATCDWG